MIQQLSGQIAILILFYNKLEQTVECINSFLPSGEYIYILNNGSISSDFTSLQHMYKTINRIHFLDAGKNLGPAGGRNFLIKFTKEPWLVFVDNDITIQPEASWKNLLEEFLTTTPDAEIICPRIFNVHENAYMDRLNLKINSGRLDLMISNEKVSNFFPEGGSIVHRKVFERYGMYDEDMFAFEGYEFATRAILSNYGPLNTHHIDSIELLHDHRYQHKKGDKEAVRERYSELKIQKSYNNFIQKHKIVFAHDWSWWTKRQLYVMTTSRFRKIKDTFINTFLKKL